MVPRVLVADDDSSSLEVLGALLTGWGYEVETASDGQIAHQKAAARPPALVITDLVMPRLNGLELLEALHRRSPDIPVIVVTGRAGFGLALRAAWHGAYEVLLKPVDVPRLKTLIAQAIGSS